MSVINHALMEKSNSQIILTEHPMSRDRENRRTCKIYGKNWKLGTRKTGIV